MKLRERFSRPAPAPSIESLQAQQLAYERLAHENDRWPDVIRVSESLKRTQARNHFSETIERLWRSG